MTNTLHVYTRTYQPVGGVVKLFDYVNHALDAGYDVAVHSLDKVKKAEALLSFERFAPLVDDPRVTWRGTWHRDFGPDDLALVSLPEQYEKAYAALPAHASPERIIHIIQNVRHVNPYWRHGYPTRLLTRPAARISINRIVADLIEPWLDPRGLHRVINLGHDVDYFHHARTGGLAAPDGRVRVAYTAWKSPIGDRVAAVADPDRFEFRAIRETATWQELRELYTWSDVFLSSPGPEEGLYLPGLEAMAAGSLVITPDVGGNMAYCRPDENCLLVGFESTRGYADALATLAERPAAEVARLREAGYRVTEDFDLHHEGRAFQEFLDELLPRIHALESADH